MVNPMKITFIVGLASYFCGLSLGGLMGITDPHTIEEKGCLWVINPIKNLAYHAKDIDGKNVV